MKAVNTQKLWTFELGTQEGINVPMWNIVGFQQRERQNSQNSYIDTFHRPPVTSLQCVKGTENNPDAGILLNFDDDDYSQGYRQIKETFRAITENDILKQYTSDHDFRSNNQMVNVTLIQFRFKALITSLFPFFDISVYFNKASL